MAHVESTIVRPLQSHLPEQLVGICSNLTVKQKRFPHKLNYQNVVLILTLGEKKKKKACRSLNPLLFSLQVLKLKTEILLSLESLK